MHNSKTVSDGFLALQNVHAYQALGRIYPRLLALEKELEDTIQSVTQLTDQGAEIEPIEEEDPKSKEDDSPRKRAQRRKETMRRRKALLESQRVKRGPTEESDKAPSRPALRFEDKEAHEKQLTLLKDKFEKVLLEYDLVPDSEKGRLAHLFTLVNQGQQKLDQCQDEMKQAEEDAEVLAHKTREQLRVEAEAKCMDMLRSGRLPTEMLGSLSKQRADGPSAEDRDALKSKNAALWMSIQERQRVTTALMRAFPEPGQRRVTSDERELQEELESLQQEIQAQETAREAEETKVAERTVSKLVALKTDAGGSGGVTFIGTCAACMDSSKVRMRAISICTVH
ncbi:unnamed protein product [Symbiodinium natans]|uniref:Uncharacterized protein n=1 Tax=Symbiodinium natans TaxID=878477 RepID=A0A812N3Z5_9DINO|nr:unnamed protein product [Symbiodinium natans]